MTIIKVAGRAKVAHLDGRTIERPNEIFVRSEPGWFATMDSYAHFVYKQDWKFGSTLMCTCGGSAGIYNFDAYQHLYSTPRGRLVFCNALIQSGKHADGSTE